MIDLAKYWMGRDKQFASEWTAVVQANGKRVISKTNLLLGIFERDTGIVRDKLSSGWRPKKINDATSNAAGNSKHITADAIDVEDLDRALAAWCVLNPDKLAACGLWMEDPRWTPHWVHLQTIAPGSGKRIYVPSTAPAKAAALPGQKPLPWSIKT